MSRRINSKSITVLVFLLTSIFGVQIQSALGRGTRSGRPELQQIELLNSESLEQSIKNLYLPDLYLASRTGAGGITIPFPKTIGMEDIDSIIKNQRVAKVYNELSKIGPDKASKMIIEQINETLPIYKRMFSESWDKVFKAHENETPSQRQTIGPSLQSDDPNGGPTLAGMRSKLFSLVILAGNLKLESTRPAIESIVMESLAQRNKFYNPNTGFEGDRFSMLRKAGLYNRQILATGILLTSGKPNDSTSSEHNIWQTIYLAKDTANSPYMKVSPGNSRNVLNLIFLKPIDDSEFDKICQDEISVSTLKQTPESNETEHASAEFQAAEQKSNMRIIPVPSQDILILTPDQTIQILQRIGFTDSQIQEHAFSIRDGLEKQGAVRILIDDEVQAGLAVRDDEVFISSRSKGQFIYNIKTGWVNSQR
ncbi:MAG: hypothetical protein JXA96_13280 [Sedimentisphaerales bacterium]|nr:hypothetical protein [Sedimentisphaerales bacterium]